MRKIRSKINDHHLCNVETESQIKERVERKIQILSGSQKREVAPDHIAPDGAEIERPSIPNYAGEAYKAKIDFYREAYNSSTDIEAAEPNLAGRVVKGKDKQKTEPPITIAGENTWFNYEIRGGVVPLGIYFTATNCKIVKHDTAEEITQFTGVTGDSIEVDVIINSGCKWTGWNDGNTANPRTFTIGTTSETYTAICAAQVTITFGGTDIVYKDGTTVVSSVTGYTGETSNAITAYPDTLAFRYWDDDTTNTNNPRTFTFGSSDQTISAVCDDHFITFTGSTTTQVADSNDAFTSLTLTYGSNVEISDDRAAWSAWDRSAHTVVGGAVYVRAKTSELFGFKGNYTTVSGHICSLTDYTASDLDEVVPGMFSSSTAGLFGSDNSSYANHTLTNADGLKFPKYASASCYRFMFAYCDKLTSANFDLPAETTYDNSYYYMFYICGSLVTGPSIKAKVVGSNCCNWMFYYCTKLTTLKSFDFPFESIGAHGCFKMFQYCTALTRTPSIKPVTIDASGMSNMFMNCTALTDYHLDFTEVKSIGEAGCLGMFDSCGSNMEVAFTGMPKLESVGKKGCCTMFVGAKVTSITGTMGTSATTLAEGCYASMFNNCSAFSTVPSNFLPSTVIPGPDSGNGGYESMFYGCTKLTTPPSLSHVTTVNESSCDYMFRDCIALTSSTWFADSVTSLPKNCCSFMYYGCTSLTSAPDMSHITTLGDNACQSMFNGCTALAGPVQIPSCDAGTSYTKNMFTSTGTARATGASNKLNIRAAYMNTWNSANAGIDSAYWSISPIVNVNSYLTLEGDSASFTEFSYSAGANVFVCDDISVATPTWNSLASGVSHTVSNGKLYVAGFTGSTPLAGFTGAFTKVSGDIRSLVNCEDASAVTSFASEQFYDSGNNKGLFTGSTTLTDASGLTLPDFVSESCYMCMFMNCTALTTAPSLPADTLASNCYSGMFMGCSALASNPFPSRSGMTYAYGCFSWMLSNTSYTPITTNIDFTSQSVIATGVCIGLYAYTNIDTPPALPVKVLAAECYSQMFWGCSSLTSAPDLSHVTTLGADSCACMFYDCTNLAGPVKVPASPYTSTGADGCTDMFTGSGTVHEVASHTGEDCIKILTTGDATEWTGSNAGIDSTYWTVSFDSSVVVRWLTFTGPTTGDDAFDTFSIIYNECFISDDASNWSKLEAGDSHTVNNGTVYVAAKGQRPCGFSGKYTKVKGSLQSIVDCTTTDPITSVEIEQFASLFDGYGGAVVQYLSDVSELDMVLPTGVDVSKYCYSCMFYDCTNLAGTVTVPTSPYDSEGDLVCVDMFEGAGTSGGGTIETNGGSTDWTNESSAIGIDTTKWTIS